MKEASVYPALFDATKTNLYLSQKDDILLWHHRLSHVSIKWIQCLMRDQKRFQDNANKGSLHDGPFLLCKNSSASSCSVSAVKCAACLCAKASTRSPTNSPIKLAMRNHHLRDELNTNKPKILKRGHLVPGDCISIDQYVLMVQGRLPWTFGREGDGYKCGTLFVDHACGKIYNFCLFLQRNKIK